MNKTKFIIWQVITFFIMIFAIVIFYALTKVEDNYRRQSTLMDLFKAGGIFSYLITFLGFNASVYGIMDFFKFRVKNLASPQTASKLDELLSSGDHAKVLELCQATDANLAEIVQAGFDMATKDTNAMANTMDGTLQKHTFKIANAPNKYLFIATLSAIIGTLGATLGMLEAFEMTRRCSPSPADLARGIEESLVSLSIGILALLVAVFFYFLNKNRINYYILELNIIAEKIISKFRT